MLHADMQRVPGPRPTGSIPYVGDNLDRLLGLLDQARRARSDRPSVWQCAWCRRARGRAGPLGRPVRRLLFRATHGICRPCAARLRTDFGAAWTNLRAVPSVPLRRDSRDAVPR